MSEFGRGPVLAVFVLHDVGTPLGIVSAEKRVFEVKTLSLMCVSGSIGETWWLMNGSGFLVNL